MELSAVRDVKVSSKDPSESKQATSAGVLVIVISIKTIETGNKQNNRNSKLNDIPRRETFIVYVQGFYI